MLNIVTCFVDTGLWKVLTQRISSTYGRDQGGNIGTSAAPGGRTSLWNTTMESQTMVRPHRSVATIVVNTKDTVEKSETGR